MRITSPEGKPLGMIQFPVEVKEPRPRIIATNVAFGGAVAIGVIPKSWG